MSELPPAEQALVAGAERRVGVIILALIPVGTAGAYGWSGTPLAVAFAVGGALAYLNFSWLAAVAGAMLPAEPGRVSWRGYAKLILPLVLLVVVLYVIVSRSWLPVVGVLAGLFLLVVAILVEAVYELVVGARA
jgi:hypothetical protein